MDVQWLIDMHNSGRTEDAAEKLQVHPAAISTVMTVLKKMGHPVKDRRLNSPRRKYSDEFAQSVVADRRAGMTFREIAEKNGITLIQAANLYYRKEPALHDKWKRQHAAAERDRHSSPKQITDVASWWKARGF